MATLPLRTKPIQSQFLGFAAVGAVGFVIDAGILTVLMSVMGWGAYGARAISFATAVTATWWLNRRAVFRPTETPKREYSSYILVQIIGALINLGVFVLLIESAPPLLDWPVIPLAIGAVAGMIFNFFASRHFVFLEHDKRA